MKQVRDFLDWVFSNPRRFLGLLALGGVSLIVSSFVIEYGFGAKPCEMCWWQRYIHWGITAVAAMGALWPFYGAHGVFGSGLFSPKTFLAGVVTLSAGGLGVAVWHVLVQKHLLAAPGCGPSEDSAALDFSNFTAQLQRGFEAPLPCDAINFTLLNLSLAEWNVLVMFAFMVVALRGIWYKPSPKGK